MTIRRLKFKTQRVTRKFFKTYSKRITGAVAILSLLTVVYAISPKEKYVVEDQCPVTVVKETIIVTPTATPTNTPTPTPVIYPIVENAKKVISTRYAQSPFLEGNRLQIAYDLLGRNDNKFKIFLAIAGNESAFGQSNLGKQCNNYWGYLYPSSQGAGCGSPRWSTPDKSIARFIELEGNGWLAKFDGTKQSLDLYDSNHGNYCGKRDDCEGWKNHIWSFIQQFSNY